MKERIQIDQSWSIFVFRLCRSRHSLTVHILVRSGASGPGQDWILRGSVAATLKIFLASKMFKFSLNYWTLCVWILDDTFFILLYEFYKLDILCMFLSSFTFHLSDFSVSLFLIQGDYQLNMKSPNVWLNGSTMTLFWVFVTF